MRVHVLLIFLSVTEQQCLAAENDLSSTGLSSAPTTAPSSSSTSSQSVTKTPSSATSFFSSSEPPTTRLLRTTTLPLTDADTAASPSKRGCSGLKACLAMRAKESEEAPTKIGLRSTSRRRPCRPRRLKAGRGRRPTFALRPDVEGPGKRRRKRQLLALRPCSSDGDEEGSGEASHEGADLPATTRSRRRGRRCRKWEYDAPTTSVWGGGLDDGPGPGRRRKRTVLRRRCVEYEDDAVSTTEPSSAAGEASTPGERPTDGLRSGRRRRPCRRPSASRRVISETFDDRGGGPDPGRRRKRQLLRAPCLPEEEDSVSTTEPPLSTSEAPQSARLDLAGAQTADLAFLVDVTGSMSAYIEGVKNAITTIVSNANKQEILLRLAFVGYRDPFGSGPRGGTPEELAKASGHFEVLGFVDSVREFKDFVKRVRASGGGDGPEDVFGGLEKAGELRWDPEASKRVLFHIADAQAHGTKYGGRNKFDTQTGDPLNRSLGELLAPLLAADVEYKFGSVRPSVTNKMIAELSEVWGTAIEQFPVAASRGASRRGGRIRPKIRSRGGRIRRPTGRRRMTFSTSKGSKPGSAPERSFARPSFARGISETGPGDDWSGSSSSAPAKKKPSFARGISGDWSTMDEEEDGEGEAEMGGTMMPRTMGTVAATEASVEGKLVGAFSKIFAKADD